MKTKLSKIAITIILSLVFTMSYAQSYTLESKDVVVESGIISECRYNFDLKDIIIPEYIDGQRITEIGKGVFESKKITSVVLPSSIVKISTNAFMDNELTKLDLSNHESLIGIGVGAFGSNFLNSVDLHGCGSLTTIAWKAFKVNKLTKLNLKGCISLSTIGENAFADHHLKKLDLGSCISLIKIGGEAFSGDNLKSYKLPKPNIDGKDFKFWTDLNGKHCPSGTAVSELWNGYTAVFE